MLKMSVGGGGVGMFCAQLKPIVILMKNCLFLKISCLKRAQTARFFWWGFILGHFSLQLTVGVVHCPTFLSTFLSNFLSQKAWLNRLLKMNFLKHLIFIYIFFSKRNIGTVLIIDFQLTFLTVWRCMLCRLLKRFKMKSV